MSGEGDPILELALNAMGYGVMMALEGRDDLIAKLRAGPPADRQPGRCTTPRR